MRHRISTYISVYEGLYTRVCPSVGRSVGNGTVSSRPLYRDAEDASSCPAGLVIINRRSVHFHTIDRHIINILVSIEQNVLVLCK